MKGEMMDAVKSEIKHFLSKKGFKKVKGYFIKPIERNYYVVVKVFKEPHYTYIDEEKSKQYYQQALDKGFFLAKIKLGLKKINSLSKRNLVILRQEKVIQIEVLYSDMLLQSENVTKETVDELYKLISSNYLATGRIYKHSGLITKLALLMHHVGYPPKVFVPMLEMAGRMGYSKAKNVLKQII